MSARKTGKFTKSCPKCGAEQTYGRKDHYESAVRGNWLCKKCGIPKNTGKGRYEDILYSWFDVKKRSAKDRGLCWDLTIEQIWDMYVLQNKKCALSGIDIGWSPTGMTATASVDRIDSQEGYVIENVQLVHKHVNFMKQSLDQDYFIDLCNRISLFQNKLK
jgi:hypothetical protein